MDMDMYMYMCMDIDMMCIVEDECASRVRRMGMIRG